MATEAKDKESGVIEGQANGDRIRLVDWNSWTNEIMILREPRAK